MAVTTRAPYIPNFTVPVRVLLDVDFSYSTGPVSTVTLADSSSSPGMKPPTSTVVDFLGARYGLALGLALGGGVQDNLNVDARLGHLAAVRHRHGEGRLVGARQDHVPALVEGFARDLHGRDLHPVQGVRVALRRTRCRCSVETQSPVIHKRLRLLEVGLIPGLPSGFEGAFDGRNVKVGDDGVARPVVCHGRREFFFEAVLISGGRLRKIVRGLGPYAQRRDDVVVRVLELGGDLLLLQRLLVLLFGTVGHLGERPVVELRSVTPGVT
jgi:hypothetical protein